MGGRVSAVVDEVAGIPPRPSYTWGARRSPLAWLAFHGIMVARVLSPLQWLKYAYRRPRAGGGGARLTGNARRDFPAALTEWYFLGLAAALGLLTVVQAGIPLWAEVPLDVVCWVLAAECATWIIHYLFLRAFIEGRFSAYHPAEYLLQFPLVCLVQCLALAFALAVQPLEILNALRGAGDLPGAVGVALGLLGIVYTGGALSVLINALPVIQSRSADMLAVVGAGEVTRARILPALRDRGRSPKEIVVLDPVETEVGGQRVERAEPDRIVQRLQRLRVPAIVASPTRSHLDYVAALADTGVRFAVEKPVCAGTTELDLLQRNPGLLADGFALSYYVLEKALPLTLLLTGRRHYLPYLEADGALDLDRVRRVRDGLGDVRSVSVRLLEDNSRSPRGTSRAWTESPERGISALVETAIHPLHLLALFAPGRIDALQVEELRVGRYAPRAAEVQEASGHGIAPTLLRLAGTVDGIAVEVAVGKHIPVPSTQRALVARFEHGVVEADFDDRSLRVLDAMGEPQLELRVRPELVAYSTQLGLFDEFVHHGWRGDRFDELDTQLAALRVWQRLVTLADPVRVEPYDDALDLRRERLGVA